MKVAIMAGLLAKGNVDVKACHKGWIWGKYNGCSPYPKSNLFCKRDFVFLIGIHLEAVSGMLSFVIRNQKFS